MRRALLLATLALASAPVQAPLQAQTLRIGIEATTTSLDPHFASIITNFAFARHWFQPLVQQDAGQVLRPAIATSWRVVDPLTWEFTLDPKATFSDGTPVRPEDVAFSIFRAGDVPNSPSSLRAYTRPVKSVEKSGPHTILIRTTAPTPLLANYLSLVMIVSERVGDAATTADYNSGRAMVGSGPFRHVSWHPGGVAVMERREDFNGPAPAFARVEFRPIPNAGARTAALQAGDVDLIEIVPSDQYAQLKADPRFTVAESPSNRLIYLTLDSDRETTPFVHARDGGPLANPLRDRRVRRALSLAINRDALARNVMQGQALPSGDLGPPGYFGTSPDLTPDPYDPAESRRLLAEAGLPQGFAVQVNGPNDRYVNDEKVVQAIAQFWTRVGLVTTVQTKPRGLWLSEAAQLRYSVNLAGFSPNPEVLGMLETQIHSWDTTLGLGTANRGRFSNAAIDAVIEQARATMDDAERSRLTQQATRMALRDETALIPLYFQVNTWAMRAGITYEARTDEMTLAMSAGRRP